MRRTIPFLVAFVLLGSCVPQAGDRLSEQIAEDAELRAIQRRGVLSVGIPPGPAGLASEGSGGLTEEAARWVADALGVDLRVEYADTEAILAGIHERRLDLGFPVMPITEGAARSKKRSYTAPYFVAHQRILVGPDATGLDDISRVCMFGDARTQIPPENVRPGLEGVRSNDGRGCARLLVSGVVDAVFAPDLLLLELDSSIDGTKMLPESYTTEGYSAVVQSGEIGVGNFFDAVLSRAVDDGRWQRAYERHLAPLTTVELQPPDLTAEEAAALFPRGLSLE